MRRMAEHQLEGSEDECRHFNSGGAPCVLLADVDDE